MPKALAYYKKNGVMDDGICVAGSATRANSKCKKTKIFEVNASKGHKLSSKLLRFLIL